MAKDGRYMTVKYLMDAGHIKSFQDIWNVIPKTVIAQDLGMNYTRFSKLIDKVEFFMIRDMVRVAALFEIDDKSFIDFVYQQYNDLKKRK
jgi:hypothetical protein